MTIIPQAGFGQGFTKSRQAPADCNNLKRIEINRSQLKDASLKKNFPGVNNLTFVFAKVFTSLKRSFPGVDDLKTGSGSTLGFTIPEVDSKMIPGVDNHGWSDVLVEMTPKSTVESL